MKINKFRKSLILLIGLLLFGCSVVEQIAEPATEAPASMFFEIPPEVQNAASQYKKLRPVVGQFNGGEWHAEADDWHGSKHSSMIRVAAFVDENQVPESILTDLLGEPDLRVHENDKLLNLIKLQPDFQFTGAKSPIYFIYFWRGEHDFLFFESDGVKITQSGWWYSME